MSIQIKPDMADRIQVSNEGSPPEAPRGGKRNWRLIGGAGIVVMLALAALAATLGWPYGGPGRGSQTRAEAPLIKAEEGPVKVRPKDPGGMQVPNRDMLVYRRLEGSKEPPPVERLLPSAEQPVVPPRPVSAPGREVQGFDAESEPDVDGPKVQAGPPPAEETAIEAVTPPPPPTQAAPVPPQPMAAATPAPKPLRANLASPAPGPAKAPAKTPAKIPASPATGSYQVQLVAVRTRDQAQASWGQLSKKHGDVLGGLKPAIVRADLGAKGVIYRLRAGPAGNESKARAICASLAKRKVDCLVIRPSG